MIDINSLVLPTIKTNLEADKNNINFYSFTIQPLLPGFGYTIGNSIRRVLLSSIPGFAVTRISINDITHEYQAIEGVSEDVINIILNIKQIRSKIITDSNSVILKFKSNKIGTVYAKDLLSSKEVEIANPDIYICNITEEKELSIEIEISRGVGYLSAEKINFGSNLNTNNILVDAIFSPVTNVILDVSQIRVGDRTDYDKLVLKFETDGTVESKDIIKYVLDFNIDLFEKIRSVSNSISETKFLEEDINKEEIIDNKKIIKNNNTSKLDLPKNLIMILEKNGITDKNILKKRKDEISDFSGITKKHLKTIEDYLK